MNSAVSPRPENALRYAVACVMAAAAAYFVIVSWHWALQCDSPVLHYVVFLMKHGLRPYSEISDNNMPGAYLAEAWAMQVFGGGDLAWRVYEFFLLGALTLAMVVVAKPVDWVAGVYAGGMFLLLHGSEGPWYSVERDEVMTTLLMVGYACLFSSVRSQRRPLMIVMGFTTAMAAAIKPTVLPLLPALLFIAFLVLRKRRIAPIPFLLWALAGMCIAAALNVHFLWQHHAWSDFIRTQTRFTSAYVANDRMGTHDLLLNAVPRNTLLLALVAAILAYKRRGWSWEQWTLLLGAGVGLASYIVQHKGFLHHRYMLLSFLLLIAGMEFFRALQTPGWPRYASAATLGLTLLLLVPRYMINIHRVTGTSELTRALQADLQTLGGTSGLQKQVLCLDMVYGCLNALYHLNLVENTGFTGDLLLFAPGKGPAVQYWRARAADEAARNPATVIVLTNEYFQGRGVNAFQRIYNWPEYAQYLHTNYTQVVQRSFPQERGAAAGARQAELGGANAYRIYVKNGSSLLPFALHSLGSGSAAPRVAADRRNGLVQSFLLYQRPQFQSWL